MEDNYDIFNTRDYLAMCKKYGDGTIDATDFVQKCIDHSINLLPGAYLVSKVIKVK